MEKLIISISKRGERSPELHKFDVGEVAIGRAYDNDIILNDPYISPHQFQFINDNEGVKINVVDEVNPILVNNKLNDKTSFILQANDILSVGKTQFQLLAEDTRVAQTRLQFMSKWPVLNRVGPMLAVIAVLVYSLLSSVLDYFYTSTDLQWKEPAYMALFIAVAVVIWAAVWAVAGRIYKHQNNFFLQLFVTSVVGIIFLFVTPVAEFIDFQFNRVLIGEVAAYITAFLFLFVLFKANMVIATNSLRTSLIAFICSIFLVGIALATTEYSSDQISFDQQNFPSTVKPPFVVISKPVSIDAYLESIAEIELTIDAE